MATPTLLDLVRDNLFDSTAQTTPWQVAKLLEQWPPSIISATFLIAVTPFCCWYYCTGTRYVTAGRLLWCKMACAIALLRVNFGLLLLWYQVPDHYSEEAKGPAAASSLASLALLFILYYEHIFTLRSSSFLAMWLVAAISCDLMQYSTVFLRLNFPTLAANIKASAFIKAVLIGLEEAPKLAEIQDERLRGQLKGRGAAGFFTRSVFLWIAEVFSLVFRSVTSMDQLPDINPDLAPDDLPEQVSGYRIAERRQPKKPSLASTFFRKNAFTFSCLAIPRLIFEVLLICHPFFVSSLMLMTSEDKLSAKGTTEQHHKLISASLLIYLGMPAVRVLYKHFERGFALRARRQLASQVQRKLLCLPQAHAKSSITENNMTDVIQDLAENISAIHSVWIHLFTALLYWYLLFLLVGQVAMLYIPISGIPISFSILASKQYAPVSTGFSESATIKNQRISKISSMLSQIKAIKVTGLDNAVLDHIYRLYDTEVSGLVRSSFWHAIKISISTLLGVSADPIIVTIAMVLIDEFSAHHIYTTMSVIVLLEEHVHQSTRGMRHIRCVFASFEKIESFLSQPDVIDQRHGAEVARRRSSAIPRSRQKPRYAKSTMVAIRNGYLKAPDGNTSILKAINVQVETGEILGVVGPNGCGKSVFMKSLVGETYLKTGSIYVKPGPIAYCSQIPWLCNMSIRDNIVAKSNFEEQWYEAVLEACALTEDLERLAGGDSFVVGSSGVRLSGGQKKRVALARAIYARHNVLVLDDVFASLDRETALTVFSRLFGEAGLLRPHSTTVVLVTNSIELLEKADRYLVIQADGTSNEQTDFSNPLFQRWLNRLQTTFNDEGFEATQSDEIRLEETSEKRAGMPAAAKETPTQSTTNILFYLNQFPFLLLCLQLLFTLMATLCEYLPPVYFYMWLDANQETTDWTWIKYLLIGPLCAVLSSIAVGLWLSKLAPESSKHLHRLVLDTVIKGTFHSFTTMNKDEVLYLFTHHMASLSLSQDFHSTILMTLYTTASLIAIIGLSALPSGYIMTAVIVSMGFIYIVTLFYGRRLRDVKRLQLSASMSLNAHINEMAAGLSHIRSFAWQRAYSIEAATRLDVTQKGLYHQESADIWLQFVTDFAICSTLRLFVLEGIRCGIATENMALPLILMPQLVDLAWFVIRQWSHVAVASGSIGRTRAFLASYPTESDPPKRKACLPDPERKTGRIALRNVVSRYGPNKQSMPVVDNVSISIPGGWKVGIIGRTGSGKSSFLLTLLNFLEYSGSIIIDDVNLADITRLALRDQVITSVSQDVIDFEGSIRYNLCPWTIGKSKHHSNAHPTTVESVLVSLGLWELIEAHGGLDSQMSELKLSQGQRQLMCIARACLHNMATGSRIVLIDEASSNLDPDIERIAHRVMRRCFEDCTVISVVHRLQTLQEYNMIFKFKDGKMFVRTQEPVIPDDDEDGEEDDNIDSGSEQESSDDGWYADSDDGDEYEPAEGEDELQPIPEAPQRWRPGMRISDGLRRALDLTRVWDREYIRLRRGQMR